MFFRQVLAILARRDRGDLQGPATRSRWQRLLAGWRFAHDVLDDPGPYGRLVLADDGSLLRIVEARDATPQERSIALCNGGIMAIDRRPVSESVRTVKLFGAPLKLKAPKRLQKIPVDTPGAIPKLYDEIKVVVDRTAEVNRYQIVFAYPDAVTPEEQANPYLKELKLKPPAAQPFFVHKDVDITGVVVQALNQWFPPLDAQNQKVDVSKLPVIEPPTYVVLAGAVSVTTTPVAPLEPELTTTIV